MRIRKAGIKDQDALMKFYTNSLNGSGLELEEQRPLGYFSRYQLTSDKAFSAILEDDDGQIQGAASIVFAPGWFDDQPQTIGYATDLRIGPSRRAVLTWSQHFTDVLEQEKVKHNCKRVFSTVLKCQTQAANALLRPRSHRREFPRYCLYRNLSLYGVHARLPWSRKETRHLKLRFATPADLTRIYEFVIKGSASNLHFPYFANEMDLAAWLTHLPGFDLTQIQILANARDEWFGVWSLWNPKSILNLKVQEYTGRMELLFNFLRWTPWLKMSQRLPKVGGTLNPLWLVLCQATHPDVFNEMLFRSFEQLTADQFLLFHRFEGEHWKEPDFNWVQSKVKGGLYGLIRSDEEIPESFLISRKETSPRWELPCL